MSFSKTLVSAKVCFWPLFVTEVPSVAVVSSVSSLFWTWWEGNQNSSDCSAWYQGYRQDAGHLAAASDRREGMGTARQMLR